MSDDLTGEWPLARRSALPAAFTWLREAFPRSRWDEASVPGSATHWLQMHAGFRQASRHMEKVAEAYRSGSIDLRDFHGRLLPTLSGFLQHLDGHHRIETTHYFPQFRAIEPRIAPGIDLLDRDHYAVHAQLERLAECGNALHRTVRAGNINAVDDAARMADALDTAASPLLRHLDDEEDIVIPLMALRG
ncbi:hemerythrin domain-containing protein [Brevundimonas variabilis]|uniref:Iron-sulfur cluster repair protein YtfE (RIC family) n=1 Tax=Brevundimonas variabilis TaxID=74312 RepID=A0A7W9FFM9_9CAUL|nr:hemerythrin domain-containing protein [Brevundimonas variabilis]MBB5747520.1 iron-sulfur cluster repair protein YtfE (RIC family) [Brevundimonas variabilis]